jgi:hypothetical protein
MGKYQITATADSQYRWVLKASNGEILITSETYTDFQMCLKGLRSSKESIDLKNFAKELSSGETHYFNQTADNGQVLGTSEMYSSATARDAGIASVKKTAPTAAIQDLT